MNWTGSVLRTFYLGFLGFSSPSNFKSCKYVLVEKNIWSVPFENSMKKWISSPHIGWHIYILFCFSFFCCILLFVFFNKQIKLILYKSKSDPWCFQKTLWRNGFQKLNCCRTIIYWFFLPPRDFFQTLNVAKIETLKSVNVSAMVVPFKVNFSSKYFGLFTFRLDSTSYSPIAIRFLPGSSRCQCGLGLFFL